MCIPVIVNIYVSLGYCSGTVAQKLFVNGQNDFFHQKCAFMVLVRNFEFHALIGMFAGSSSLSVNFYQF